MEQLEEFDEVMTKLLTKLRPEQRVAGLAPEQLLLTLPVEALRALSDTYIDTLSEPTRLAIRARTGR